MEGNENQKWFNTSIIKIYSQMIPFLFFLSFEIYVSINFVDRNITLLSCLIFLVLCLGLNLLNSNTLWLIEIEI